MNLFEMLASVNRPKCAAVDQMHPGLREKMDQAIISHDPPCLRDVMIQFQARANGVPQSTFYHYARRLRAHAKFVECLELAHIEGVNVADAMTALLDGEFMRIFTSDGEPKDPDDGYDPAKPYTMDDKSFERLGKITLYQDRLAHTLLNRTKNLEAAQRLKQAPVPAAPLPPLARGDKGGFDQATKQAAPATHTTNDASQPPEAPAPAPAPTPTPAPTRDPRFYHDLPPFPRKTPPGPPLPEKEFRRRERESLRAGGYGVFRDGTPVTYEEYILAVDRAMKRMYNLDIPEDWCKPFPPTEENRKLCQDYMDNWKDDIGKANPAPPPKMNRNPMPPPVEGRSELPPLTKIDKIDSDSPPLARGDQGGFDKATHEPAPAIGTTNDAPQPPEACPVPVAAPTPPTTPAGRHQPTAPESPLPPLARGDQGGFDKATNKPAPAIGTTNDAPQPPEETTPSAKRSVPRPTHKMFGGGPYKPRIDPAIEDAEDEAARRAGRPIHFDFEP